MKIVLSQAIASVKKKKDSQATVPDIIPKHLEGKLNKIQRDQLQKQPKVLVPDLKVQIEKAIEKSLETVSKSKPASQTQHVHAAIPHCSRYTPKQQIARNKSKRKLPMPSVTSQTIYERTYSFLDSDDEILTPMKRYKKTKFHNGLKIYT